jgi:putative PIN family toxin of toxin-antitoxin system
VKLVLDTNVLLAGLLSRRGASHWILRRVLERKVPVAVSVPLFLEYEEVLSRPVHLRRIGWTTRELAAFLEGWATVCVPTAIWFLWRPGASDPSDEMVVECVASSRADALVTFDIRHMRSAAREFGFRLMTPRDAVRVLMRRGVRP